MELNLSEETERSDSVITRLASPTTTKSRTLIGIEKDEKTERKSSGENIDTATNGLGDSPRMSSVDSKHVLQESPEYEGTLLTSSANGEENISLITEMPFHADSCDKQTTGEKIAMETDRRIEADFSSPTMVVVDSNGPQNEVVMEGSRYQVIKGQQDELGVNGSDMVTSVSDDSVPVRATENGGLQTTVTSDEQDSKGTDIRKELTPAEEVLRTKSETALAGDVSEIKGEIVPAEGVSEVKSETLLDLTLQELAGDMSKMKSEIAARDESLSEADDRTACDTEWLDILGNGLLKKKVLKSGDGRASRPVSGNRLIVSLEGKLESGEKVDCEIVELTLGDGDVIQALDLCLALMEKHEVCELITDPKYAYGNLGRAPDVPSEATITYTVVLLEVNDPVDITALSVQESIKLGDAKRERGNYLYLRNEHAAALNAYTKALAFLERSPDRPSSGDTDELQQLLDTRVKCYNNQAAAQIKIDAYEAAIKSCDTVLMVQPDNVKALFRKGKALGCKAKTDEAIACLRKALSLEPESKLIHQELSRLVNELKYQNDKQKDLYRRMLGQDKVLPPAEKPNTTISWYLIVGAIAVAVALAFTIRTNGIR